RLGADEETAWHGVEMIKAVLSRAGSLSGGSSAGEIARTIILNNYDADDFRRLLGINVFDDITWFNKECFDRALRYVPVFAAMESGDLALTQKTAAALRKAEAESGYQLGELIEALDGGGGKAKKGAAQSSGVK
ncbi:MAG: hypothetical protein LBD09_00585, partial [Treponema sp.]|nr:hypothetical protein [Treponema sp.]